MLFWGLFLVVVTSIVACAIVLGVRRYLPKERRDAEVEAIGFVFAVVGVLYAIVIAFVIIDVWSKMTATEENVYREASALVETYWYAQHVPLEQGREIRKHAREYADHVIEVEFPRLARHDKAGIEGWAILDQLRRAVERSHQDKADELQSEEWYGRAIEQVYQLGDARDARISGAHGGVPAVLWFVLIGGGLLTVAFAYVFDISGLYTHMLLAIGLTAMTVLLLWAVYQLEFPFARQLRIGPEAFEIALARFAQITRGG